MGNNEWQIGLSGKLDKDATQSSINTDITEIQNRINKIKVNAELDPNSITRIEAQLAKAFNQKVTVGNIQVDTSKVAQSAKQSGQQIGHNIGDSINNNLTYSLNSVKNNIDNVLKSVKNQNLRSADLSKMFNLNRADIDISVLENVRTLVKEINKLGYESVKTGSESSVGSLLNKVNALHETLMKFGSSRDLSAFKESLDVLDYFQGKKIFVDKSEAIANTGLSIKELNNQFRNLGVTFTSVKQGATQLDTVWEELFRVSPSMQQFTNVGDQINAVVSQLKIAKEALYGNKNLVPVTDEEVSKPLVSYIHKIDNLMRRMNIYKAEEQELNQAVTQSSTSSTTAVIQNEQKKQQEYQKTAQVQSKLNAISKDASIIKSNSGVTNFNNVKEAKEWFAELLKEENAVIAVTEKFNNNNALDNFTINIKRASGEVESLKYKFFELEDGTSAFALSGSVLNDAGAIKQVKQIEKTHIDYINKLNDLKTKYSEASIDYSSFEKILNNFKQGTVNVNELATAFNKLSNSAKLGVQKLKSQDSSFDPIQQTLNNMRDMPSRLSNLSTSMESIKDKTNLAGISVHELNKKYKELQSVMSKNNGKVPLSDSWTSSYRELMSTIESTEKQVKSLKKAEASDNSQATKQANYYSSILSSYRQMYEIKKKIKSLDANSEERQVLINKRNSLSASIASNYKQLNNQGLIDKNWQSQVDALKKEGEYQLSLTSARIKDKEAAQSQAQAQKEVNNALKEQQILSQQSKDAKTSIGVNGDTISKIEVLRNNFTKLGLSADEVRTKMSNVDIELGKLKSLINSGASDSAIVNQFNKLKQALTQTQNNLKTTRSEYSLLATEQQRLSLANHIEKWMQTNSAATSKAKTVCNQYITTLRDLNTEVTKLELANIRTGMGRLENSMRSLGKLGASLKNQWTQAVSSFSMWFSASSMVMKLISETRESITTIKELDNTLTEISKTSDMTKKSLEELGMTSYDTASKYGRTANDYLNAFESMSRSGFYGEVGKGMSELSLLAQSAGDMTQEVADNYLIATNAAYKYEGNVEKLGAALDGMNMIKTWSCYMETYGFIIGFYLGTSRDGQPRGQV